MSEDCLSEDRLKEAASIISELLVSALMPVDDKPMRNWLNPWERDGIMFLAEQMRLYSEPHFNIWAAKRVLEFEAGQFRYDRIVKIDEID